MSTNRETERDTLVSLIDAAMVGSGNTLQAVYGYQDIQFSKLKQSPVAVVNSAGTERSATDSGANGVRFYYNINVFVVYKVGKDWLEADAEDRLDLIEKEIYDVLKANRTSTRRYTVEGRTQTASIMLDGEEYRRELIPVSVWLPNG